MPTVVIIHAAEDTLPARALAEKLRQAKVTVELEKQPGEELRTAVKSAPVTIALWSPRSAAQPALADEVAFARGKSKVLHALMQSAQAPDQFRGDKSVNLTGWRGEDDFAPWRELAKLVTDKAGVAPLPPPTPKPASGFFQPGRPTDAGAPAAPQQQQRAGAQQRQQQRPAPQQQAQPRPASRPAASAAPAAETGGGGGRTLVIAAVAFIVVAIAGGGGYWFWSQSQTAQATSTAWENVERNNATALRAFISGNPGDFRDEAEAALAELEERTYEAASDADTIEAFEAFLNDFPESEHALAARGRVAELRTLPETPEAAEATETAETAEVTLEAPADPDLVPPGATPEASGGGPATLTPPTEETPNEEPADAPTE